MTTAPEQLLFLPGAAGDPAFWQPVADRLTHPARRLRMGWPGFGAVPADPSVNGIGDLVDRVVRRIDRPSALIAQSMGGVIALQAAWARRDLVTHMVLTATSGGLDMSDLGARDWRPAFAAAHPGLPGWFADYTDDLGALIGRLPTPALLLWGDADPISPVAAGERLRRLLPDARLHLVPGGGHDLAWARAASVAPLIDAFLAAG